MGDLHVWVLVVMSQGYQTWSLVLVLEVSVAACLSILGAALPDLSHPFVSTCLPLGNLSFPSAQLRRDLEGVGA